MTRAAFFLPSLAGGGAERVFVQLANAVAARGVITDLLLATVDGPYLSEVDGAVYVKELGGGGVLRAVPGLIRYIRSSNPDVIVSALDHANVASLIAHRLSATRSRCIVCVRSVPSVWRQRSRSLRSKLLYQAMRTTYRKADMVIANSTAVRDDIVTSLGLPDYRIEILPNPVDVEDIQMRSREPLEDDWLTDDTTPLVLAVGRLESLKDYTTLLEAFARVRARHECRLLILGEGPDRGKLESRARELGLADDFRLPGFVSNPFPWMCRAAVLVSSSISEGCPNVVLQALACRTPLVVTNSVGGVAEVLEGGRWGDLVPVGDSVAMAESIEASLLRREHPDGLLRAQDFSVEKIVDRFIKLTLPLSRASNPAGS